MPATLLSTDSLRHDGRRPHELRSFQAQLSTTPHANGSATIAMGNSKAIVTIHGPREPKYKREEGKIDIRFGIASFAGGGGRRKRKEGEIRLREVRRSSHLNETLYAQKQQWMTEQIRNSEMQEFADHSIRLQHQ